MLRAITFATLVLSSMCASGSSTPVVVNCDAGQSLGRALAKLDKLTPTNVNFQGTCTEYVQIDRFTT